MAQPLRFEDPDRIFFITTRTMCSRMWFLRNPKLQERILAYLAKYQAIYGVKIFAFCLMGNHYHLIAKFPRRNKAMFMQALNSITARLVARYVPTFEGGKLWERRYSEQVLPRDEDVRHWYFYSVLNPILAGASDSIEEYKGYSSFHDSVAARKKCYRLIDYTRYSIEKRFKQVTISDYVVEYELGFERLPDMEACSAEEYEKRMQAECSGRIEEALRARVRGKIELLGRRKERKQPKVGDKPVRTKKSGRYSFRPLVLSLCRDARETFLHWYFDLVSRYREASDKLRKGLSAVFPTGTYRPSCFA